jgi:hypothetical protein
MVRLDRTIGITSIQNRYSNIDLGRFFRPIGKGVTPVAKGTSAADTETVIVEVTELIKAPGRTPIQGQAPK